MSEEKKTKKTSAKTKDSGDKKKTVKKESSKKKEGVVFSGEYIGSIGRRKTAVAQVRLYKNGSGDVVVNNVPAIDFFKKEENLNILLQPLKTVSKLKDFNFSIVVKGGGIFGQLEAARHGISRALIEFDPELKDMLKTSGFLTRDPRKKERKKPGLKKARKAPQWSKR
jgi:small subunit ribosomal protein S9